MPDDASTDSETETESDSDAEGEPGEEECKDEVPSSNPAPRDDNDICDVRGEHRSCVRDDKTSGTQFCEDGWGPCLGAYECIPGEVLLCFLCDPEFGTWWETCRLSAGVPSLPDFACSTPLVLRLDPTPVEFLATADPFLMTAADRCPVTDWPTAATPWLALDLDRSGTIDGGHELFGSGTRLGPTRASDGFAALAPLDSDHDRRITPADARWSDLLLWSDHDADRRSTAWELLPLAAHGVTAIDLAHHADDPRCDLRGNCEIERAPVTLADGRAAEVVDIRLACQ